MVLFCAAIRRDSVSLLRFPFLSQVHVLSWDIILIIIIIIIIIIIYSFRVFHISASWWSSTGIWVTASLFKSPGLFSVFRPFSLMLSFGWSPHFRQLPTQSCLALYSFWANLQHSLIMWLIVSSLSPHCLHLLLCCVLSILALIWLVLMALSCAAIRRGSVSLFFARSRFFSGRCCLLDV